MKSRTSYFNKTIFLKNSARFWPIWSLYLVIWILVMPITMMNSYGSDTELLRMTNDTLNLAVYGGLIMSAMFCAVSAALVFMFAYSARSANFMASLPVKRECVFITAYLSGVCWFIVSHVIVFLLSMLAQTGARYVDVNGLCQWFAIVSLFNIVFYSIAVICVVIAGNIVGAGLLYAAANGGLIIVEMLLRVLVAQYIKGMTFFAEMSDTFTKWLTPVIQLWGKVNTVYNYNSNYGAWESRIVSVSYDGWTSLLIYAAAGLVLSVMALFIYRRRHMETASDLISVKPLRPVFKYLMTMFCALTLGMLIYVIIFAFSAPSNSVIPLSICMIFGGAIGYFGSEMLLHKSFRVFKNRWKGFAVCALAIIIVMAAIRFDVMGLSKRVPDPANVKDVSFYISSRYEDTDIEDPEAIKTVTEIHRLLIGDEYTADVGGEYGTLTDCDYSKYDITVRLTYHMKNGGTIERRYYASIPKNSELYTLTDSLVNTPAAILSRVSPDKEVTPSTIITGSVMGMLTDPNGVERYSEIYLDNQQARYIYENCIIPDALDGNVGRINVDGSDYNDYMYEAQLTVYLQFQNSMSDTSYTDSINLDIPSSATRTCDYIKKLVAEGSFDEYGNFINDPSVDPQIWGY